MQIPPKSSPLHPPLQVIHAVVGVVVIQVYMVYKLALFLFVAACHFLQNSLEAWLAHLTSTMDG